MMYESATELLPPGRCDIRSLDTLSSPETHCNRGLRAYHPVSRWRFRTCSAQKPISRAADAPPTSIQYVGVDHREADALVAEEFLNGTHVASILEKVRGTAVAERVAGLVVSW